VPFFCLNKKINFILPNKIKTMKTITKNILILIFFIMQETVSFSQEIKTTASKNVKVDKELTYIKQLDRYRRLRIYLPPDYDSTNKKYPVLYMQDAQNLFDVYTSYTGEWGVDDILDSMFETTGFSLIVVGIDNGESLRINEYLPWDNTKVGKGEGPEFVKFIVEDLKPMIDNKYRTLPDRENTAIMGSSMGGLISHYALFKYPEIFSKAGILSPAYWISINHIFNFTQQSKTNLDLKIYMLVGRKEGKTVVKDCKKMKQTLFAMDFPPQNLVLNIDSKGKHCEAFWNLYFEEAINFLFDLKTN